MTKQGGLGGAFFVAGVDISGDVQSIDNISGAMSPLDVTDITQSAHSRLGGLRDGEMDITTYFDALVAHPVLSALPTTDEIMSYCIQEILGGPVANLNAKQIDYAGTRDNAGNLTFKVQGQANQFGLEWGQLLTAGNEFHGSPVTGVAVNTLASAAFGATIYIQVFGFTGTDATIKVQDSADNATWADLSSAAWAITTGMQAMRIQLGATATVRQYLRCVTTTVGGFTALTHMCAITKNLVAVTF